MALRVLASVITVLTSYHPAFACSWLNLCLLPVFVGILNGIDSVILISSPPLLMFRNTIDLLKNRFH